MIEPEISSSPPTNQKEIMHLTAITPNTAFKKPSLKGHIVFERQEPALSSFACQSNKDIQILHQKL